MSGAVQRVHGGISASPSCSWKEHRGDRRSVSRTKCPVLRPDFSGRLQKSLESEAVDHAATIISTAFPGPSEAAVCNRASQALGVAPNTIRGILRKETKRVDFGLIYVAIHHLPNPAELPGMMRFITNMMKG